MIYYICWYALIGALFLFTLLFMEAMLASVRGPEYAKMLREAFGEPTEKPTFLKSSGITLMYLIGWPIVALMWAHAGWHRMGYLESLAVKAQQAKKRETEKQQATTRARYHLLQTTGTQGTVWMCPEAAPGSIHRPYLRVECYGMELRVTHMLLFNTDTRKTFAARIGQRLGEPPIQRDKMSGFEGDFEGAVAWCNADVRWNELALKGSAKERAQYLQAN